MPISKIFIYFSEISAPSPFPHLIIFLNITGKMPLLPLSLFLYYILPHGHNIPSPSSHFDKTDHNRLDIPILTKSDI